MTSLLRVRSEEALGDGSLAIRLTALLLLLDPMPVWYLRLLLVALVGLGFLFPAILRTPGVWLLLALIEAGRLVRLWPTVDQHQFLLFYWCLAVFLALLLLEPRPALSVAGRWLLAAIFLWGVIWKVALSPGYLDGRYFTVQLVTDGRWEATTRTLAGVSPQDLQRARDDLAAPFFDEDPGSQAVAAEQGTDDSGSVPPSIRRAALLLTWGVLLFQAALALAFLLSWGRWTDPLRNGLLLAYCLVAYLLAPIPLFGPLLLVMGLAQVPLEQRSWRVAYLTAWFGLLLFTEFPRSHLSSALRRFGIA